MQKSSLAALPFLALSGLSATAPPGHLTHLKCKQFPTISAARVRGKWSWHLKNRFCIAVTLLLDTTTAAAVVLPPRNCIKAFKPYSPRCPNSKRWSTQNCRKSFPALLFLCIKHWLQAGFLVKETVAPIQTAVFFLLWDDQRVINKGTQKVSKTSFYGQCTEVADNR